MSEALLWARHALEFAVPFWAGCAYWKWVEARRRRRSASAMPTREEVDLVVRHVQRPR